MMFDLVVRVASRPLQQIKPLLPIQSFDIVIVAPAYILSAFVYVKFPRNTSTPDEEESAIFVPWVLLEKAGDEGRDLQQLSLVRITHLKNCVSSEGPTTWNVSPQTTVGVLRAGGELVLGSCRSLLTRNSCWLLRHCYKPVNWASEGCEEAYVAYLRLRNDVLRGRSRIGTSGAYT